MVNKMSIYKTNGLKSYQNIHQEVFRSPKGSLSHWAVTKIDYSYRNELTKINPAWAHLLRRVVAIAMPIFNLLDVIHYVSKATFHLATLRPKDSLYDLQKCLKCLQLFFCSIPALPVAVVDPKWIYRSEEMWLDVKNNQMKEKIFQTFKTLNESEQVVETAVENLRAACGLAINALVGEEAAVNVLNHVLDQVILEIPADDPSKQEVVIEQNIELFSELLVYLAHQEIELNKLDEKFTEMLEMIIKIRHPSLRSSLIHSIISIAKNEPELYSEITTKEYENDSRQALAYCIARLFTDDKELLERLLLITKDSYFKNRTAKTAFIATLYDIYQSELSTSQKNKSLNILVECFELDQRIALAEKPVQRKKGIPKNVEERDEMILKKQEDIKQKEGKIKKLSDKQKHQKLKLNQQIAALQNEIETLQQMILLSDSEKADLINLKKEKGRHFDSGQDVLCMLLSLNDPRLISDCLEKIGPEKEYPYLSDEGIITNIFKIVFDLESLPIETYEKIKQLRAPWALVAFHGKLKKAKKKRRTDLVKSNKEVVQSLLDGTYDELRHEVQSNPTLAKVFEARTDLKKKWMQPSRTFKVKDLFANASKRYKHLEIVESKDPSDILLVGSDTHTCVHLGGRIEKVSGLSAFIRDGKIHSVLIKNDAGVTIAEIQMILLWDEQNQKPVLFLEQANFIGEKSGDYSLEHAIYAYAKERSKELELDLVTCYKMKDPKGKLKSSKKYEGKVSSLGSSAPVEFVNFFHTGVSKPYDLGPAYYVEMD